MKLLARHIEKTGEGSVQLQPQEMEDLWHCYNLIVVGDRVKTVTIRKVIRETATGSSTADRMRLTLTVRVTKVQYEVEAAMLRIHGINTTAGDAVRLGAHHTLEIELNRAFTLEKDMWDSVALDRVAQACDPARSAEIAAVVLAEGLANVCLITDSMTVIRARVEAPIPRKRRASTASHEKALTRFFEAVL
jgi:protein pelota